MVDETILYGVLGIMAAYIALRWYLAKRTQRNTVSPIERELTEILNRDEYKVKGRFE